MPARGLFARVPRRLAWAAGAGVAAVALSCTFFIETRASQCNSDGDCAAFPNAACDLTQHLCVDKACAAGDCVCAPKTPVEILNACPRGDCEPFDHGRVKASFDGGPPEPPLDDAGAPPPTWSCGSDGGTDGGGPPILPACEAQSSPLYILGPDSIKPLLGWVAKVFANETPKTTVVFQSNSSCTAVKTVYDTSQSLASVPDGGAPTFATSYYDAAGQEHACAVHTAGIRPDIGLSDVFAQTCGYNTSGSDQSVTDTPGPVQAMGFVVPNAPASTQTSISAEAAYMIYGFGAEAAGVAPWTDTRYVFQRSRNSGTQNLIGTAIGLDPNEFHGSSNNGSDDEAALVGCSPKPAATLGILAVDYAQTGSYPIRLLAYQHYTQGCAYFPDTTDKDNDKRNVRDGHYFIWGPVHMMVPKDAKSPNKATEMINYVSGIVPPPVADADIFQIWADAHLVPQCAMRVTRSSDGGPLAAYRPPTSCYCKYDEITTGKAGCPTCKTSTDCPADRPACSPYGYCEPQ